MLCSKTLMQAFQNRFGSLIHAEGECLCAQAIRVAIDHQTGESIGFAMKDAVSVCLVGQLEYAMPKVDGILAL
jgi:hypothetical protein